MRNASKLAATFFIMLCTAMPAAAQVESEEEAPKSYVMSYFAVGLGIGLGLVAVCRSSKRRKDVRKPE